MADIKELQKFAAEHGFGLTAPLTHSQVVRLAEYWLPRMCFHWDERFHPITLDDVFTMVSEPFSALPLAERDAWRVWKFVRVGPTTGGYRAFDPPVVHVPDGSVPEEQEEEPTPGSSIFALKSPRTARAYSSGIFYELQKLPRR